MDPNVVKLVIYLSIMGTIFLIGLAVMSYSHRQRIKDMTRRMNLAADKVVQINTDVQRLAGMMERTSESFVNLGEAMAEMINAIPSIVQDIETIGQKEREAQALFVAAWPNVPAWIYEETPTLKALADQIMEIENSSVDVEEEDKERGEEYFD